MSLLNRALERAGYVRASATDGYAPAGVPEGAHNVPRQDNRTDAQRRQDALSDVLGVYSSRHGYRDLGGVSFGQYEAEQLYASDGLAALIVDRMAEDAVSPGFKIVGDETEDILNEFDRLDATRVFIDALRWARLYGAAAIMPLVEDGLPLDAPLDVSKIERLTDLMVYSAPQITMQTARYSDATLSNYGWPTHYEIRPTWGEAFVVHETRLLPVPGDPLPPGERIATRLPWLGRPVLNGCYKSLMRYRRSLRLAELILERKQQPVHKMSDLGNMLAAGQDDIVAKRLEAADLARGILTTVAVDAADDFKVIDTSLSGVPEAIRENKIAVAADTGYAMLVLFQEQPSGMNATGAGEHEGYHQRLTQLRERAYRPLIEGLAPLIWAQRSVERSEPNKWRVEFFPLWSPTAEEEARTAKAQAEAKKAAIEAVGAAVKQRLISTEEGRVLLRQGVYKRLPDTLLPPELDPDNGAETARQTGANAIKALLESGLISVETGLSLARRLFPGIPENEQPPTPLGLDPEDDAETEPDRSPGTGTRGPEPDPSVSDAEIARETSTTAST